MGQVAPGRFSLKQEDLFGREVKIRPEGGGGGERTARAGPSVRTVLRRHDTAPPAWPQGLLLVSPLRTCWAALGLYRRLSVPVFSHSPDGRTEASSLVVVGRRLDRVSGFNEELKQILGLGLSLGGRARLARVLSRDVICMYPLEFVCQKPCPQCNS